MVRYLLLTVAAQSLVPPPPPPPPILCDPFMLFFEAGSARLTANSQRMIDNIVSVKDQWKSPIKIIGYADAPGSERDNLALSRRRAEAVRSALVAQGIPASMLIVGARGETGFFVDTDAAEAQNRRVQVSECEPL
jgi:OmpA-OmpF porin, OOP family